MTSSIITLTTDFGSDGPYAAQMKGVILSMNPRATLVDITHAVPPQDIRAGALALLDATSRFPRDSIHIAVVDPGVGTDRGIVAAHLSGRYYVAPDNGLLSPLIGKAKDMQLVRVSDRQFWLPEVSNTFHGRDIMSPVAAHLSLGVPIDRFGPPLVDPVTLDWPLPTAEANQLSGQIIAADSFGNLITNISREDLPFSAPLSALHVSVGQRSLGHVISAYGQRDEGATVGLFGSNGRLEIAIVCGNALRDCGFRIGDGLCVSWSAGN